MSALPKLALKEVDETSLTLHWGSFDVPPERFIRIQYKLPHESWDSAKVFNAGPNQEVRVSAESQVADLTPGNN